MGELLHTDLTNPEIQAKNFDSSNCIKAKNSLSLSFSWSECFQYFRIVMNADLIIFQSWRLVHSKDNTQNQNRHTEYVIHLDWELYCMHYMLGTYMCTDCMYIRT